MYIFYKLTFILLTTLVKNLISQIASNIEVIIYFYNVEQCSGHFIVFIVFNIELKNEKIVKMNGVYVQTFLFKCIFSWLSAFPLPIISVQLPVGVVNSGHTHELKRSQLLNSNEKTYCIFQIRS